MPLIGVRVILGFFEFLKKNPTDEGGGVTLRVHPQIKLEKIRKIKI